MSNIFAILIVASSIIGPIPSVGYGPELTYPVQRYEGELYQDMKSCTDMFKPIREAVVNMPKEVRLDWMACMEASKEELSISEEASTALINKVLGIETK